MRKIAIIAAVASLATVAACDNGGTSTEDVKEAATEHARQKLGLPVGTPLKTTVWIGSPFRDQMTVCGTVSSAGEQAIVPQRFVATTDPLRWEAFEDAHNPMMRGGPGRYADWSRICGLGAQS